MVNASPTVVPVKGEQIRLAGMADDVDGGDGGGGDLVGAGACAAVEGDGAGIGVDDVIIRAGRAAVDDDRTAVGVDGEMIHRPLVGDGERAAVGDDVVGIVRGSAGAGDGDVRAVWRGGLKSLRAVPELIVIGPLLLATV